MIYSVVLYAIALFLFALRLYSTKKKGIASTVTFVVLLAISIPFFAYEHGSLPILISGVILANAVISYYGTKLSYLYIAVFAVFVALMLMYHIQVQLIAQVLMFGLLSGSNFVARHKKRMNRNVEISRNSVQIASGIVLISVFYIFGMNTGAVILISAILLGLFLTTYSERNNSGSIGRLMYRIERNGLNIGVGATWLAIGSLVSVSFLNMMPMITVFAALFIGDSLSTIVGISYALYRIAVVAHVFASLVYAPEFVCRRRFDP